MKTRTAAVVAHFDLISGGPIGSLLLDAIPAAERAALAPYLEPVTLRARDVLITEGEPIRNCYFPIDAVTSTVVELPDGETLEAGMMGAEGFVGLSLLMREPLSNTTVMVQIAGRAVRISAADLERRVLEPGGALRVLLLRYANAFMALVAQNAACNAVHSAEQRLARWLLMTQDRIGAASIPLTQEFLAIMLGVRRATVTDIALRLRERHAIWYAKGQVEIVDRDALMRASCDCYDIMNEAVAAIFRLPPDAQPVSQDCDEHDSPSPPRSVALAAWSPI